MKLRFFLLVFIFLCLHASAVVNVCVDADGRKTFTDSPCLGQIIPPVPQPIQNVQPIKNKVDSARVQVKKPVFPPVKRSRIDIWAGEGYTGFLKYFFTFVGVAGLGFLFFYLIIFISARFRKRTSGIADAKS